MVFSPYGILTPAGAPLATAAQGVGCGGSLRRDAWHCCCLPWQSAGPPVSEAAGALPLQAAHRGSLACRRRSGNFSLLHGDLSSLALRIPPKEYVSHLSGRRSPPFSEVSWLVDVERGFELQQVQTRAAGPGEGGGVLGARADGRREPVYSSSDTTVTFLPSSAAAPALPMPSPCTQFVLGCESKQYLSWQQLLFRWSLLPRRETAA